MDKGTRNRIQAATQKARALLEDELGQQLEGVFDIRPDGTIGALGSQLSGRQRVVREKILASIEHERSSGRSPVDAVATYTREAAFTTLNRFVALTMLEARGLLLPCISQGEQSSGFKEFAHLGLADGLVQLDDHGYRLYIESLFDEIAREVGVLFDRRDPTSLLWPRRTPLAHLLEVLNDAELSAVWAEDETIGWVFQFFNSGDERKKMRDESQAPRNSRELAVRNQFFTPRYVVEFLVDNTLGRMWLEMFGESSRLRDFCKYFVRSTDGGVRTRPRKDPRDLRILDPACGSGHFLLYCFDLLLIIYEEAWADEARAVRSSVTGRTLRDDYPDLQSLRRAVPTLILEHNLFGVDIDPRAAQIAALALWMRAQRAWKDDAVPSAERPPVERINIVVAEPMPGDAELVEEFARRLQPPLLGDLFRRMVSEMRLAGELGSLIPIERAIAAELGKAREQFVQEKQAGAQTSLTFDGLEPRDAQGEFDLSGIDDDRFFHEAEAVIVQALRSFSDVATGSASVRRRLFSRDALQGVALVDLLRHTYDVVVMNPPFGKATPKAETRLRETGSDGWKDVYAGFLELATALTGMSGIAGAITSSQYFHTRQMQHLRERMIATGWLRLVIDLGPGVLDGAAVQAALLVASRGESSRRLQYADLFDAPDKESALRAAVRPGHMSALSLDDLAAIPGQPLCLHASPEVLRQWQLDTSLDPHVATVATGNHTFDDARFVRLRFEVATSSVGGRWTVFDKGGEFMPFFSPSTLLLQWGQDGAELRAVNEQRYGSAAQVLQASRYWHQKGLCYTRVSSVGFSPRILVEGTIFSSESIGIFIEPRSDQDLDEARLTLLGFLASTYAQELIWVFGRYRKIENRAVSGLPISFSRLDAYAQRLGSAARRAVELLAELASLDETSPLFAAPDALVDCSFKGLRRADIDRALRDLYSELDECAGRALGLDTGDVRATSRAELVPKFTSRGVGHSDEERAADLAMWAVGVAFGRWGSTSSKPPTAAYGGLSLFERLPQAPPACAEASGGLEVLVDDDGHPADIISAVDAVLRAADDTLADQAPATLSGDLRVWCRKKLFTHHLRRYSGFRRKAPIYWQFGTPTGSYSVWLYAHRANADTLFRVLNDVVTPKLRHEERKLTSLTQEAGLSPSASQRKDIESQRELVEELRSLRDEVARVAPLWRPELDDGILVTCAPLWRLVPQHRVWQRETKACWARLTKGEYDWSHSAMHLWPERVVRKCAKDRSLAIAHGLEEHFWAEDANGKWASRPVDSATVERLVQERSSAAVKAALADLLAAG